MNRLFKVEVDFVEVFERNRKVREAYRASLTYQNSGAQWLKESTAKDLGSRLRYQTNLGRYDIWSIKNSTRNCSFEGGNNEQIARRTKIYLRPLTESELNEMISSFQSDFLQA